MLSGIGAVELLILVGIAVLLFGGPAVVAFWFGYNAGKKSAADDATTPAATDSPSAPPSEDPEGSQR